MSPRPLFLLLMVVAASAAPAVLAVQTSPAAVEVVKIESRRLDKPASLPGDLLPYQSVAIYARVPGFLESIAVDRGSSIGQGDILAVLSAPEIKAHRLEAEAKVLRIESQRAEANAKLASLQSTLAASQSTLATLQTTYDRLKGASETPGVVAGNDLDIALRAVDVQRSTVEAQRFGIEAQRSAIEAIANEKAAAEAAVSAVREMEGYLRVTAPFDGVVTERNVHPGALVGPAAGPNNPPIVRIEQTTRLRLVVPVPEAQAAAIAMGSRVAFTVPLYPNQNFQGIVRRSAQSLDLKTRTMLVELDVDNSGRRLSPGMFADVSWPVRRAQASLFIPTSAVVTTTERSFVIRVREGVAEWVDVKRGVQTGTTIEVFGSLQAGDSIVLRGTDELRPGTRVAPQSPKPTN